MRSYNICCLPGDGIGPEIMAAGRQVLDAAASRFGFEVNCQEQLIGGAAIDECGDPLPAATLEAAQAADAVLLASVGGPKWDSTDPSHPRPEQGLLGIRKALGLYCNLRPVHVFDALVDASSLKPELVRGVDMLIVRELTGGLYFGARERIEDAPGAGMDGEPGIWCSDACEYGEGEIERVVRYAFEAAAGRPQGKVCSVDKANVLDTSRLWRDVSHRVAAEYPQVAFSDMLVDNCAMQLVARPAQFDVIVTENTFGDILSDEASMVAGSLGMLASASLGDGTPLFEPSHGSAPDIAGQGIANPLAQILSVALMCRHGLGESAAADTIEAAVESVLNAGWRTVDIVDDATPAECVLSTDAMAAKVVEALGE
ncbi:3-isopropylmalate dehydrogenase [Leptogranulimonas caecicola]|uniref:3-isopropylmalate dehydrogenase n=1 Tax=Leptogranulimonas caecicola TaxID=2894156 RepID=A0AAU9CA77_9ACTN|nr:3-isopropylmalate dehydrogenase [Leptogranulimonas caecicola]BDC90389.1 3-isopropylmalate dehydrogenase [Leptogranulimonas caecicola]